MYIAETEILLAIIVLAAAVYFSWNKGYQGGYHDACFDVAHGNIKVTLEQDEEEY